jgi:hypothetical protein
MDPHDFLTLAERLAGGTTAAEFRTVVSRSYYGRSTSVPRTCGPSGSSSGGVRPRTAKFNHRAVEAG